MVEDILASGAGGLRDQHRFRKLAEVRISADQLEQLQLNLLRSHACGVGEPFPEDVVRAMLLLRANVLATGHAGCRPAGGRADPPTPQSRSPSGGAEPGIGGRLGRPRAARPPRARAHRRGGGNCRGERLSGAKALAEGWYGASAPRCKGRARPDQRYPGFGCCRRARRGRRESTARCSGRDLRPDPRRHGRDRRGFRSGGTRCAAPSRSGCQRRRGCSTLLVGSEIRESHRECGRVQDAYSLRCSPQVHGAGRRCPRARPPGAGDRTQFGHRQPHGLCRGPGDFRWQLSRCADRRRLRLSRVTLTDVASISERRLARMVDSVPLRSASIPRL